MQAKTDANNILCDVLDARDGAAYSASSSCFSLDQVLALSY